MHKHQDIPKLFRAQLAAPHLPQSDTNMQAIIEAERTCVEAGGLRGVTGLGLQDLEP